MEEPPKADDFNSCVKYCIDVAREYRRPLASLPENFSCAKDGSEVLFLAARDFTGNSLYAAPLLEGDDHEWRKVESPKAIELTLSQVLQRERKRLASTGITHYKYIDSSDKILVDTGTECRLIPRLPSAPDQVIEYPVLKGGMDYKLCPSDEKILACVRDGDIWLLDAQSNCVHQLTNTASERPARKVTAAQPSFVMQEEFERYTGYWWSPSTGKNGKHQILYEEVDETQVDILHTLNPSKQKAEDYHYPQPGSANASSTLMIVEFSIEDGKLSSEVKFLVRSNSAYVAKWEYITRLGWTPDGDGVWLQLLDREQQYLQTLVVPSTNFLSSDCTEADYSTMTFKQPWVIWEEKADYWINIGDQAYTEFFPDTPAGFEFFTISMTSGYPHLVLVSAVKEEKLLCSSGMADPVRPQLSVTPLTTGEWSVLNSEVWVDLKDRIVYFRGNKPSCLESHLFALKLSSSLPCADPAQLTRNGFYHKSIVFPGSKLFVSVFSSRCHAPAVGIFKIDDTCLTARHMFDIRKATDTPKSYVPPTSFTVNAPTGEVLHGVVYPPGNRQEGQKYPTVVYVYGGPVIQFVTNEYSPFLVKVEQLALAGMAVIILDNRGTAHRGCKFEGYLKGRLGDVEVEDQVLGLKAASEVVDYIDLKRVGVYGSSYGGYMSLMCLAKKPQDFKLAIVYAPVTDWYCYDTGYTERYLGVPPLNTQKPVSSSGSVTSNYENSSVFSYLHQLPNEPNRLLIAHGLNDENVLFTHTSLLLDWLVSHRKPYQLQIFTGERHGIRSPAASVHCQATILSFLLQHL